MAEADPLDHLDDVHDVDALLERFAPGLAPRLDAETRFGPWVAGVIAALVVLSLVAESAGVALVDGALAAALLASLVLGAGAGELLARFMHAQEVASHRKRLAERPWEIQSRLTEIFRTRVEGRRAELLGPESPWAVTRRPLEEAAHEAERSLRYWEERREQDPRDASVEAHLTLARELAGKLGRALASLDRRGDALRSFLDRCEAKLAVLERGRRDTEESRKLTRIAQRADQVVEAADQALHTLARRFVEDAGEMARALSGLERVRLLAGAEDAPLSAIEEVADRILEEERRTEEELRRLDEVAAGFGDAR